MAFSNTLKNKELIGGGLILETGTWNGDSVTTGTITADTTTQPEIVEVVAFGASSDGDTAVDPNTSGVSTMKLTFTTSDTGKYFLIGKGR